MKQTNTDKKIARILLRVSSNQQLDADGDLSTQRQIILEHIKQHDGWILDEKEYFEGGVSGYKNSVADRDVLQEALQDAKNNEYDILVVYKDDRLGRRTLEVPTYILELKQAGVDIYTVKDGWISPKGDDTFAMVTLVMRYANAEKSSRDTGMRVKDTAKQLVKKGKFMGGKAPYGYELVYSGETSKHGRLLKHPVIIPEQAEVVKHIFHLSYHQEFGSSKIARILNNDEAYKNMAPNDVWRGGTITSILTNPLYAGYTSYNRRERIGDRTNRLDHSQWILSETPNPALVIVPEELWQKAQEKRLLRKAKYTKSLSNQNVTVISRNDGMLSLVDVIHCGYCGRKMTNGTKYNYWTIKGTGERRTSKIPTYRCPNAWQGIPHEKSKSPRADEIEPIIYSSIAEYMEKLQSREDAFNQIIMNNIAEKKQLETVIQSEIKKLEKIQHHIFVMEDKIPEAITGEYALTIDELKRQIDRYKEKEYEQEQLILQKKEELQNAIISIADWEEVKTNIPTWHDMLLNADNTTKRVLVNKLIERIDITDETVVIRFKINLNDFFPQTRISDGFEVQKPRL
ncbi:MAG: recombinase family protein [Lachnospiraceae bacterium]|nr:recombinase family protein [Lachnospiraceae bacterium]